MKISLKPAKGKGLVFSMLPERIRLRGAAKYQGFDIITKGTVKVPLVMMSRKYRGTENFLGNPKRRKP